MRHLIDLYTKVASRHHKIISFAGFLLTKESHIADLVLFSATKTVLAHAKEWAVNTDLPLSSALRPGSIPPLSKDAYQFHPGRYRQSVHRCSYNDQRFAPRCGQSATDKLHVVGSGNHTEEREQPRNLSFHKAPPHEITVVAISVSATSLQSIGFSASRPARSQRRW